MTDIERSFADIAQVLVRLKSGNSPTRDSIRCAVARAAGLVEATAGEEDNATAELCRRYEIESVTA
jgi:hypothetical protein